jgi:hypothetical protein
MQLRAAGKPDIPTVVRHATHLIDARKGTVLPDDLSG